MWNFISGAFLGWSLGSNDAANVFGTGVATNMIKYRTAIILIAIFVMLGAVVDGPKTIQTIGKLSELEPNQTFFVTFAAAFVLFIMSKLALPTSSSQAIVGAVIAFGLVNNSADWSMLSKIVICWILTPVGAAVISLILYPIIAFLLRPIFKNVFLYTTVIRIGIIFSGCYGAYALGGNNVANVSGVYVGTGEMTPVTASVFGGFFIALGVLTFSKNVMMAVGKDIFPLDAFTAFIAVLAHALTIHVFTFIGVPVSGSQAIVGAVLGIGLLKNFKAISLKKVTGIVSGWLATPVITGVICYLFYLTFSVVKNWI